MGWTCTPVSGQEELLVAIEKEPFDVVLLDLDHVGSDSERAVLRIKEIRPSLSGRIVAISGEKADPQILELIERHDLPHLLHVHLLSQLWSALEDLFTPRDSGIVAPRNILVARLVSDSFRSPSPQGIRSSGSFGRHFTYEHNDTTIDLLIHFTGGSDRISVIGQVLEGPRARGRSDSLPVVLVGGNGTLARTTTNHLGEFNLESESADNVSLEVRLGGRSWVTIPLGQMDWGKREMPDRKTGT
jgi:CheY-like chemotaxis protein